MPLTDLAAHLRGEEAGFLDHLIKKLKMLYGASRFEEMRIWPEQRLEWYGKPALGVELRLPDHT